MSTSELPQDARVEYHLSPPLPDDVLNALFAVAWEGHETTTFSPVLSRSLLWMGAAIAGEWVGFVNVAWDGGAHAFLLDTTVHPSHRHRGIGTGLVTRAADAAAARGVEWLHVDYEPHLASFYAGCGFRKTEAGLIHLASLPSAQPGDGRLASP